MKLNLKIKSKKEKYCLLLKLDFIFIIYRINQNYKMKN